MTRQSGGQTGITGNPDDRDEVDDLFDAVFDSHAKECGIEEIDPSKPGWEIFLHFQDSDPRVPGTQAHEDFSTLKHFANLGIAKCEYKDGTRTVVLSYLDGCCEDEFSPEHIELMGKYQPRAKAPETARRRPGQTATISAPVPEGAPAPETVRSATRDSAAQILLGMKKGLINKPLVIQHFDGEGGPPPVIFMGRAAPETAATEAADTRHANPALEELVVPEDILIEIPLEDEKLARIVKKAGCRDLEDLIAVFKRIADEEELLLQHSEPDAEDGERPVLEGNNEGNNANDEVKVEVVFEDDEAGNAAAETYMINMYKDPGVKYAKPMDADNMAFIHRLQDAIRDEE